MDDIRWGNGLILVLIVVTTSISPEKKYAKNSGQLDAILENSANHKDVLLLKSIIDTLTINYKNFYFPIDKLPMLFLGDVEPDYALFERSYTEYKLNKGLKPFSGESLANQLSITEARSRLNILISQQSLNKKEIVLKKKDLERFETLYGKGVISGQEYDQKQLDYLQAQRSYRSIRSSISQLRETINNSQQNLKGTEIRKTQNKNFLLWVFHSNRKYK